MIYENISMIYVSSPMTGYPDFRRKEITETVEKLRENYPDIEFLSPVEIAEDLIKERGNDLTFRLTYRDYLERDLQAIVEDADAIALMQGWKESNGCKEEIFTGIEYNLRFFLIFDNKLYFNTFREGLIEGGAI